jgi:hypothetical protein
MPNKSAKATAFVVLLLGLYALLINCGDLAPTRKTAAQPASKYQLSISPSGQVYRLDVTSGEVALIENIPTITNGNLKLTVGSSYETENGKVLNYVGNEKFELRPTLDDIFKKHQLK